MAHMILVNGDYAQGKFVPEGATIIDSQPPTSAHKWEGNAWVFKGFSQEQADMSLRGKRNALISETDWQVLPDLSPSQAVLDYRQALRDLPENSTPALDENGQLNNVTWPEMPE
jgi:hypothetical protein